MNKRALSLSLAVLALSATAALAQDQPAPPAAGADPGGTTALACMNAGNSYKVGEYACVAACHGRRRLARCDAPAATAAPAWTYVSDVCPSAMINAPWPSDWSEVPVVTAMSPVPLVVNLTAIPPDGKLAFADFGRVRLAAR